MQQLKQQNTNLEGDWSFRGYYPEECKPLPSCHTKKIHFSLQKESKDSKFKLYNTSVMHEGEHCPVDIQKGLFSS